MGSLRHDRAVDGEVGGNWTVGRRIVRLREIERLAEDREVGGNWTVGQGWEGSGR